MTQYPETMNYRAIETLSFGDFTAPHNEKADIWSIGAILYEMLTGHILFEGNHSLIKALEFCGPVPENVLQQIDHKMSEFLRKKSQNVVRVDFINKLSSECRPWLKEEIEKNSEELRDFIDRTLVFDQEMRMSVDEALAHDFLSEVREIEKETIASQSIVDVGETSVKEWKRRIWEFIQTNHV
ncbi:hypothetical protein PFISCL1PPCAC_17008 [Pristionchus fissidentatus]|uniref:Protein kinase domain-containing protein n=1 Tax=Pristionchus fissidentatus TaxID=1538716 RepID=A0AAV5W0T4_9BILA|nr:hypothetical protein PFISCL1PPCAC_17008 [Pristionchus fissidentatus]